MNSKLKLTFLFLSLFLLKTGKTQDNVLHFDGVDDYVDISAVAPSLDLDKTFTIELWMKADPIQNDDLPVLFAINNAVSPQLSQNLLTVAIETDGQHNGELYVSYGTGYNSYSNVVIADGNCHHIAYVRNDNEAQVYIDGSPVFSPHISPHWTIQTSNSLFLLGQEFDAPFSPGVQTQHYTGIMDDIRIWNTARSGQQISNNMESSFTTPQSGLVANYNCDQGSAGQDNSAQLGVGLVDNLNSLNGVFNNFTLNNSSSNLISDPRYTVQLTAYSNPQITCTNDDVTLYGGPLNSGITGWIWSNTSTSTVVGNSSTLQITPPDADYFLSGTAAQCVTVKPALISIEYLNAPTFTTSLNEPLCEGGAINITATNTTTTKCSNSTWTWSAIDNGDLTILGSTTNQLYIPSHTFSEGTVITVEFCCGNGCCETQTIGTINSHPTVTFPPVAPIELCGWTGEVIHLNASSDIGNCNYSSLAPGLNTSTGVFDPQVAGPGQYWVTYECDYMGCLSPVVGQTITVTEGDWHQSTLNTQGKESANDVITDAQGNVYVTGEYEVRTTLDGGTLPSVLMNTNTTAPEKHSYTAKYDECANLLWVNYSTSQGAGALNWGTSITLDENNGVVYCVGNFTGEMNYEGPYGDPLTIGQYSQTSISSAGFQEGYVVQMDIANGEIHYLEPVQAGKITELRAVTINENSGEIFVGGHKDGPQNAGEDRAFVNQYSPNINGNGPLGWQFIDVRDGNSYINDMDFNENQGNGGLWAIGEYDLEVEFDGLSGGTPIFNNNIGVLDAFVLFADAGTPTQNFLIKGNSDGLMTGRGIAIDESNGYAFVTGSYEGAIGDPFQLGGFLLANNGTSNAYFVALDDNANSPWNDARYAEVSSFEAKGVAAAFRNEHAYFTGTYTRSAFFDGSSPMPLTYQAVGGSAGNEHIYLVSYDQNGEPVDVNGTEDPTSNTAIHNPTGISADQNGHAFIVGSYQEDMGYIVGNPASGVLTSSGSPAIKINAFIMRSDLQSNLAFKSQEQSTENDSPALTSKELEIQLSLAPNPTSNQTLLKVIDYDSNLNYGYVLYGIDGKIILQGSIDANGTTLDLNACEAGIYFIKVSDGTDMEVAKILKVD